MFACATATALHGHFLKTTMDMLGYEAGAAMMDVYTPCGTENGIPEDLSTRPVRLAVESRISPVFVHDPRRGSSLAERFSLDGNPDPDKPWTTSTLAYVDENGNAQLLSTPLTPAEFALGEVRFKKQFRKLAADATADAVPIAEFVESARGAAGRQDAVRVRDGQRPASDQGRVLDGDRRAGRGAAPPLADPAVPGRSAAGAAEQPSTATRLRR